MVTAMNTKSFNRMTLGVILLGTIMLCGCELVVRRRTEPAGSQF